MGLSEEDIHGYTRNVALTDVFDAFGSARMCKVHVTLTKLSK